jgi:hypothetical protein
MTDRDRFAAVIDTRFRRVAFLLRSSRKETVESICDYLDMRDREAAKAMGQDLRSPYALAHRLLLREEPRLFTQGDPMVAKLEEQCRTSNPATRMLAGFHDAENGMVSFDEAFAKRRVRWLQGAVRCEDEFSDIVSALAVHSAGVVRELIARQREQYLGMKRTLPVNASTRGDVLSESIPFNQ